MLCGGRRRARRSTSTALCGEDRAVRVSDSPPDRRPVVSTHRQSLRGGRDDRRGPCPRASPAVDQYDGRKPASAETLHQQVHSAPRATGRVGRCRRSDSADVFPASYDTFYRLLANVPGDGDEVDPFFEFTDYVNAKQALARGQASRANEILTAGASTSQTKDLSDSSKHSSRTSRRTTHCWRPTASSLNSCSLCPTTRRGSCDVLPVQMRSRSSNLRWSMPP